MHCILYVRTDPSCIIVLSWYDTWHAAWSKSDNRKFSLMSGGFGLPTVESKRERESGILYSSEMVSTTG